MNSHLTWIKIVLTALATFRLTQLIVRDAIFEPARAKFRAKWSGWLVDLLSCMWCVSVYVAIGTTALTYWAWSWWQWVALALTATAVTGFLSEHS